ncbi:MAG TPA: translation elongation factor Ts [Lactobacillaceae bacterium]
MADVKISAAQVKELRELTGVGMMDAKKALVEAEGNQEKAVDILREKGMAKAAKKGDRVTAEGLTFVTVDGDKAVVVELNSETDFVAGNAEFNALLQNAATTILAGEPADVDAALALPFGEGTLGDEIIRTTQVTGEKITLRRFAIVTKTAGQSLGAYTHAGGSISVLALLEGANEEVAKDVAMHAAAIAPQYTSADEIPSEVLEHEKSVQMASEDLAGKPENIKEKMVEGRINKFKAEISLVDQAFVKGDGKETVGAYVAAKGGKVLSFVRFQVGEGIEKQVTDLAEEVAKQLNA